MKFHRLWGPAATELAAVFIALSLPVSHAFNFTPIASPNLDLSGLGRVALTGNFDSIIIYGYAEQSEATAPNNGSQALLTQIPNGAFSALVPADASINAMVPFVRQGGQLAGIVIGGNFTSLGSTPAQGVALWDPNANKITPLPGLNGSVNALYCNSQTDTVYVGGNFKGGNSTNAIAWVGMTGWANTPFAGFNGPVNSITKSPNGNIVFGGSFTGLGNTTTPTAKDEQVINLSSANISTSANSSINGFSDPKNIICRTGGQDGAGNTWLLPDNAPGFWRADHNFGFRPTKLRLWNTHQDGRGVKTFRFTAFPINGIMNMTYYDPASKTNVTCDATCPLSNDKSTPYTDFHFINVIGMSSFRLDISEWYGPGAGLNGIELFQDDIYAYAVDALNEPDCTANALRASASTTGPWTVTPSGSSGAQYLTTNLESAGVNSNSASVTFLADIKQAGNYTVTIFTPGCQQDGSCGRRGIANVTGVFSKGGKQVQTQIFQTNDFDKYDEIYHGSVDEGSSEFRPSVTLSPKDDQTDPVSLVALRVRYEMLGNTTSSGGLNGLFEFDPNSAVVDTEFSKSKVNSAGTTLDEGASVRSLAVIGDTTYVGGNFTNSNFSNIFAMRNGDSTSLPNGGLNNAVATLLAFDDLLLAGGNFTDTAKGSTTGLSNVAIYNTTAKNWQALGGGVNGDVSEIVPILLNTSGTVQETCISINGNFTEALPFGTTKGHSAKGIAIWVPSGNGWAHNLNITTQAVNGQLTASANITGVGTLYAGSLSAAGMAFSGAASLSAQGGVPALNAIGLQIQPLAQSLGGSNQTSKRRASKRDVVPSNSTSSQNVTGVTTGLFVNSNGQNLTVLAGHFTATATDGSDINNIAIVNNTGSSSLVVRGLANGLDADSIFMAVSQNGNNLYAGGMVTGTIRSSPVNGIVVWDLGTSDWASQQLPPLSGPNPYIGAIAPRPSSSDLYVGGSFEGAGGLGCNDVCSFTGGQWVKPGANFAGNVSAMLWQGHDQLLVAGNVSVANNGSALATYDAAKQTWSIPNGAATAVPGPVTALSPASSDASSYWLAGTDAANGSAYLIKYDGTNGFQPAPQGLGRGSLVRGLSVLSLTQSHDAGLLDPSLALLVTGALNLPGFGNASAALFNGTNYQPFILSQAGGAPGSLAQVVTEQQQSFNTGGTFSPLSNSISLPFTSRSLSSRLSPENPRLTYRLQAATCRSATSCSSPSPSPSAASSCSSASACSSSATAAAPRATSPPRRTTSRRRPTWAASRPSTCSAI